MLLYDYLSGGQARTLLRRLYVFLKYDTISLREPLTIPELPLRLHCTVALVILYYKMTLFKPNVPIHLCYHIFVIEITDLNPAFEQNLLVTMHSWTNIGSAGNSKHSDDLDSTEFAIMIRVISMCCTLSLHAQET